MSKLLSVILGAVACCVLSLGSTGCGKKGTETKATTKIETKVETKVETKTSKDVETKTTTKDTDPKTTTKDTDPKTTKDTDPKTTKDTDTKPKTETKGTEKVKVSFGAVEAVTLKQGEKKTVTVKLNRGDYKSDLKIDSGDAPKGLDVKWSATTIKGSDSDVMVTLTAADDATVGTHTIHITGTGDNANVNVTPADLKVTIEKK